MSTQKSKDVNAYPTTGQIADSVASRTRNNKNKRPNQLDQNSNDDEMGEIGLSENSGETDSSGSVDACNVKSTTPTREETSDNDGENKELDLQNMSRRALHPKNDDKDIPTGSPKASPGRPRRNKQQKSTPTSRRRSPKSPHNDSEEFESDVDQETDLESETENDFDELKSTPPLKNKGLYPDLSRETRQRKKDDASKRGRKGKENNRESFQTSFEYNDDKTNKKEKDESSNKPFIFFVLLLIGGFVTYTVLSQDEMTVNKKNVHIHEFTQFKEDLTKLKSEFPGQSQRFWKVIGSQVRRILTEESPNYPAILLLGIPSKQPAIGACFTKKIVRLINKAMNASGDFYIDVGNLDGTSPDKTKLDLDQRMLSALESSKSVVLDHIETLPGEAALLLHAYCDGDNAPYKDAVIFLVLHPSKTFPDAESKQDSFMEDILVDLWQDDLGKDEMPALQSRIANNIAVMRTEKDNVCA